MFDVSSRCVQSGVAGSNESIWPRSPDIGRSFTADTSGRAIGNQLIRSGTLIGANYRAACRSRSRAEFAAKLGVVAEEADETVHWLQLIRDGDLLSTQQVAALLKEADELTAIFTAGRRTSTKNQTSNLKP